MLLLLTFGTELPHKSAQGWAAGPKGPGAILRRLSWGQAISPTEEIRARFRADGLTAPLFVSPERGGRRRRLPREKSAPASLTPCLLDCHCPALKEKPSGHTQRHARFPSAPLRAPCGEATAQKGQVPFPGRHESRAGRGSREAPPPPLLTVAARPHLRAALSGTPRPLLAALPLLLQTQLRASCSRATAPASRQRRDLWNWKGAGSLGLPPPQARGGACWPGGKVRFQERRLLPAVQPGRELCPAFLSRQFPGEGAGPLLRIL